MSSVSEVIGPKNPTMVHTWEIIYRGKMHSDTNRTHVSLFTTTVPHGSDI